MTRATGTFEVKLTPQSKDEVSGALHGRHGTFVLKHDGTMRRGVASLTLGVVPDSGTGDLTGLDGVMQIIIEGRQHSYVFDHTLDAGA